MKKDKGHEGFSCVPTNMDDFLIVGTNPEVAMGNFEEKFLVRTQEIGPGACLGSQWKVDEKGKRKVHSGICIKEATRQLESRLGQRIRKNNMPLSGKHRPELDELALLASEQVAEF